MIAAVKTTPISSPRHCELVMLAVDACEDGAWVSDQQGQRLYSSRTLDRLLWEETERAALERSMDDARHALVARAALGGSTDALTGRETTTTQRTRGGSLTLQVRTAEMEYRLHATAVTNATRSAGEQLCIVWVRRCKPQLLTATTLRERYGLTPREIRVSTLLAARLRSREIAEVLGISIHTARRHAEAVLRKIGVQSRAELRDRLRDIPP